MTTHRLTSPPSPRPNWTNCCLIHRILQIWSVTTSFCFQTWKSHSPPENVFFRRVKEVGESLGQVYRAKRRLCWEINHHFFKIFIFLFRLSTYPIALGNVTNHNTITSKMLGVTITFTNVALCLPFNAEECQVHPFCSYIHFRTRKYLNCIILHSLVTFFSHIV